MLSNAINFLSDKRKRFHRSDTMPAFKSIACQNNVETQSRQNELNPQESSSKDKQLSGIFHVEGCEIDSYAGDSDKLKATPFQSGEVRTAFPENRSVYLTTENFAQSECDLLRQEMSAGHRRDRLHGSQSKLETISLPLQCRNPLDLLSTEPGGPYSLSPSPLSFGSSGSPGVRKEEDYQNTYHMSCGSSIHQQQPLSGNKICLLGDERRELRQGTDPPTIDAFNAFTEKDLSSSMNAVPGTRRAMENKEATNYVTSARNRVAQIRAKAGGKSKLHRSNSSAQVLRQSREPALTKTAERVRSTSTQRETNINIIPNINTEKEGTSRETSDDHKRRARRRGKNWMDRGQRSRSVTSSFHKTRSPCPEESVKTNIDLLVILSKRATSEQHCKIRAADYGDLERDGSPWNKSEAEMLATSNTPGILTDLISPTQTDLSNAQLATSSTKLNRYAVVRRLRRNNSTINWPADRPFPKVENELNVSTSQVAGDLLLPSRESLLPKSGGLKEPGTQQMLRDLYTWIDQNNIDQIINSYPKLIQLINELKLSAQQACNDTGLTPFDYSMLTANPKLITLLLMLGFQPGTTLRVALESGPSFNRLPDPIKFFLTRRIGDAESAINTAQVDLDTAVARANALSVTTGETEFSNMESTTMNIAFSEVAQKERDLLRSVNYRDKLSELRNALERYPLTPPQPRKVILRVYSPQSILVRISPSRLHRTNIDGATDHSSEVRMNSKQSTSCESSDYEVLCPPCEGRRLVNKSVDEFSSIIMKYRIEWSYSANFQKNTFACTVEPPVRFSAIVNKTHECEKTNDTLIRTGFYELSGLRRGVPVFVRVFAFGIRGWSEPCYSKPPSVIPSSWIEALPISHERLSEKIPEAPLRYGGEAADENFLALKKLLDQQLLLWIYRQPTTSNSGEGLSGTNTEDSTRRTKSPLIQRKRSFRFPFTTKRMKFVKQTKSGVYLALLCHTTPTAGHVHFERETFDKAQLILVDDFIPMVCVSREERSPGAQLGADMNWFARLLGQPKFGTDLQLIIENLLRSTTPSNLQFRLCLLTALQKMQLSLGSYDVGVLYPDWFTGQVIETGTPNLYVDFTDNLSAVPSPSPSKPVEDSSDVASNVFNLQAASSQQDALPKQHTALIFVLVKYVKSTNDVTCSGGLRWYSLYKFLRQNKLNPADFSTGGSDSAQSPKSFGIEGEKDSSSSRGLSAPRLDLTYLTPEMHLLSNLNTLLHYSERRALKLIPGLYVSLIQMQAHFDQQAKILSARSGNVIHMLPVERIRRRTHVCRSEWVTLYNLLIGSSFHKMLDATTDHSTSTEYAVRFCQKLHDAWMRLAKRLNFSNDEVAEFRFYLSEVIQISPQHAFILIFPKTDLVCLPPGQFVMPPNACTWIFMTYFERNLGMIYDPVFYATASSLLSMLEILIPISSLAQRQCINDLEMGHCTERYNALQSIYQQIDTIFQEKRWLSDAITAARDRKRPQAVTLLSSQLRSFVESLIIHTDTDRCKVKIMGDLNEVNLDQRQWKNVLFVGSESVLNETIQLVERRTNSKGVKNLLSRCNFVCDPEQTELVTEPHSPTISHDRQVTVIRVYAGYNLGLAQGTSVKVLVSLRATARDIVQVVVNKLNKTLEIRRKFQAHKLGSSSCFNLPVNEFANSDRFCLTVTVDTIERCVPDNLRPLLLQEPWRSGRMHVRLIEDYQHHVTINSPSRLYLALEEQTEFVSGEKAGYLTTVFSPVRPEHAQFCTVGAVLFHKAVINLPPIVYYNGKPVKYV